MEMIKLYSLNKKEMNGNMNTMYGKITGKKWYEKEKERIGSQPGRTVKIVGNDFFVNMIAQ